MLEPLRHGVTEFLRLFLVVLRRNKRFVQRIILFASISASWGRLPSVDWRIPSQVRCVIIVEAMDIPDLYRNIQMDLCMPIMDGIEATRQITARQPHMRVVAVNSFIYPERIIHAIKAGAMGCVIQESAPSDLIQSIYKVYRGEQAFDQGITP